MTTDERPPAERLLAAAEELFGERSFRRTTVADICARAGMATGSFYAHYASKVDIFAAVVRGINSDLRGAMRKALEQNDLDQRSRERACFAAYFGVVSKRPWIDRIVRESEFVAPGLFREYFEHLARGYARGVRAAQQAGEVDARYDPEVIAYIYTGIGNFVGMRWADWTAGGRVPDDVLDDVLELLARGLPPRKLTTYPQSCTADSPAITGLFPTSSTPLSTGGRREELRVPRRPWPWQSGQFSDLERAPRRDRPAASQDVRGELGPVHPLEIVYLGLGGHRVGVGARDVHRAHLVLHHAVHLGAVPERRQRERDLADREAELLLQPPAHRVRQRLARRRVAAAGVCPHPREYLLGQRPAGEQELAVAVEHVARERQVQGSVLVMHLSLCGHTQRMTALIQ
jgi:AcrR family transcriptional regulator